MHQQVIYFLFFLCPLFSLVHGQTDCIVCDSRINPGCASLEGISQLTQECEFDSHCLSFIDESGHTIRGCPADHLMSCGDLCVVCMGNNCNDRIYPNDRQECHQCVGCGIATEATLRPCVNYHANDQCFVAVEENTDGALTTYRGCTSDPHDGTAWQGCAENDQYCHRCDGNGCNANPQTAESTLMCVQCGPDDEMCNEPRIEDVTACSHHVPFGRADECYTYRLDNGTAQRGCLLDPSTPAQYMEQCNGDDSTCSTCSMPGCNIAPLEDDVIHCIICDESVNPDCRLLTTQHALQLCPDGPVGSRGCFRSESNNNVVRGCVSSLPAQQLIECQIGDVCKICTTDGCNAKVDFQNCYNCNSGLEDDCLRVQNNTRPIRVCQDYMDTCINIIQDLTRLTIRGCTLEVDTLHDTHENQRTTCPNNLCNNNIFPVWRTNCHQCSTGEECNRNSTETTEFLLPCKIFWQGDMCYSVLRGQQALRGCTNDFDENVAYCQSSATCEVCTGVGCNFRPASRPPTMSCVNCMDDEVCSWGFPNVIGDMCQDDVWMGQVEGCYTHINPNGQVRRGCMLSSTHNCPEGSTCNNCFNNNCNNVAVSRHQCVHCRSNRAGEESCAETATDILPRECSGDFQEFTTRGCYTMRIHNDIVIRGCLRDLHPDDYSECQVDDNNFCILCQGDGCNTQQAPTGTASMLHLSLFVIFVSLGALGFI